MRLLAWNILHGGGTRVPGIVEEIASYDPDTIALTGFRTDRGTELRPLLKERGWPHVETSHPPDKVNGIAVFSRTRLRRLKAPAPPADSFRWLDADLPEEGFGLTVLQIRAAVGGARHPSAAAKTRFWEAVLKAAESRQRQPFLFAGAWNTGAHGLDEKGRTFVCAEHFARLSAMGWTDLWRLYHPGETEWTWRSNQGNGFRVDHAFASPALLPRVRSCRYSHAEREARISDHSIVIVDID